MARLLWYEQRRRQPSWIFPPLWWDQDLNSGLCACKAGAILLEPHVQSIFSLVILEVEGLANYLPRLASALVLLISASHIARITGLSHQLLESTAEQYSLAHGY
jgi:hypothetical protein